MTRKEAIKILKAIRVYECYPKSASEETKEAIDMAIEALSERNIARDIATILENEQDMRVMLQNAERPLTEEIAIEFLQDSGWLPNHDKEIGNPPMLVRCKDCRHRDLFSCPLADNDFQKDDDYCSWGERREP